MQETSGVLIVGRPGADADIGAAVVASYAEAKAVLRERKPSVIVFGAIPELSAQAVAEFSSHCLRESPHSLWILTAEGLPASELLGLLNTGRVHDLVENVDDPTLSIKTQTALEQLGEEKQKRQLANMFSEQSLTLKRLSEELEQRVEKRQKTLRKSLGKLEETKSRLESLHKALLGIHRASTVLQIEQTLKEVLKNTLNLDWVKVRFANQSLLSKTMIPNVVSLDIPFAHEPLRGELVFAPTPGQQLKAGDIEYLQELTEPLGLALARIHKLGQAETLKAQWQATFDSISHPLCLTNPDYEILKMNLAFQQACNDSSFRSLLGKNAFRAFFNKDHKSDPNSAISFRETRGDEMFEVFGEVLRAEGDRPTHRLLRFRPIADEVRYERRIVQASKLAELGTIGSSIAHELNNPLGGMLSFLQLILMDLPAAHTAYGDIKSMEQATLRCRDIVLNLLSFARRQDLGEIQDFHLQEVILKAVRLIELQSKSKGIQIDVKGEDCVVTGSANALSQAICNLLQNSIDAIAERLKVDPQFAGRIEIELLVKDEAPYLRIHDNGTGIAPSVQSQIFNPLFTTRDPSLYSGMGLTTAYTIVNEHHGTLEILSQTGSGTKAILSLPARNPAGFNSRKSAF